MKKILSICCLVAMLSTTQYVTAQTGIRITVLPQFVAGTLSGGSSPLCYGVAPGIMNGTLPTGGQGVYTYQWQQSLDGGTTWTNVVGATGVNYTSGVLFLNTMFRRNDTDSPCGTVTTNSISIIVYGQFLAGVTTGGTSPICNGSTGGVLTSTAGSGGAPGTTYQWQLSIDGGITWNDIVGQTALPLTIGVLSQNSVFRVTFINPSCGNLYGNAISFTVYAILTAGTVTGGNTPICFTTNGGILSSTAPTGGSPGTTLQWESSNDGITYTTIVGQTALTTTIGNLNQTMWYRLLCTNACGTVYSNVTTILVYGQFVAGTLSLVGLSPICFASDPGVFSGTVATGGAPGTSYQWQQSLNAGVTWTNVLGATLASYDPANLSVTTLFRRQDVNSCTTIITNALTITVYPAVNYGVIGAAQTLCSGSTPTSLNFITPPSGGNGIFTYQWESSPNGLVPWTAIPGATLNTYQSPSLTSGIWYRVIVTFGSGCGSGPALP